MLHESDQLEPLLSRFGADPVRGLNLRKFARPRPADGGPARLLVDNPSNPQVLIALRGAATVVEGELPALTPAFTELLAGNVQCAGGWPMAELAEAWAKRDGQRYLSFVSGSRTAWRAARIAGFINPPDRDEDDREYCAYQWGWTGAPRHGAFVQYPCRVVEAGDEELLDLLRQGIHYDHEGSYIRQCLANGPSFVCEVPVGAARGRPSPNAAPEEGRRPAAPTEDMSGLKAALQPVAWACTHLNGFMGMLYTPPEHRRQGYARSLWAFQIDSMLEREGVASCQVVDANTASLRLMHGLGGTPLLEPIVWYTVLWPD